eukprot:899332-Rhodomonas_salina.2
MHTSVQCRASNSTNEFLLSNGSRCRKRGSGFERSDRVWTIEREERGPSGRKFGAMSQWKEYTNDADPAHSAAEKGDLEAVESYLSGEGAEYLKRVFEREIHINSTVTDEGNRGGWTLMYDLCCLAIVVSIHAELHQAWLRMWQL